MACSEIQEASLETLSRTIVKAGCYQATGLCVTTALVVANGGTVAAGLSVALGSAALGTAFYFVHERLWSRIRWGARSH